MSKVKYTFENQKDRKNTTFNETPNFMNFLVILC